MKKKKFSNRFGRVAHALLAPLARFLLRVRVHGRENVPKEGGAVVAINHISFLDVIAVSASFPGARMPRYLAKAELFRIPLLASFIRALGAIPLDRGRSDVGAVRQAIEVAEGGELLGLFPQGTRQKGKNPADTPIKSGVAMITARAKCPILPVCIRIKRMRYAFLRRVDVIIGKPILPETLGLLEETPNYREAAEAAFREVCALGGYTPTLLAEGDKT